MTAKLTPPGNPGGSRAFHDALRVAEPTKSVNYALCSVRCDRGVAESCMKRARWLNRSSGPHRPCAGWHRRPWSARRPPDGAGGWWPPPPRPWRQRRGRGSSPPSGAPAGLVNCSTSWSLWKAPSRSSAKSAPGGTRSRVLGDPLDCPADGVCIRTPPPRAGRDTLSCRQFALKSPYFGPCDGLWSSERAPDPGAWSCPGAWSGPPLAGCAVSRSVQCAVSALSDLGNKAYCGGN